MNEVFSKTLTTKLHIDSTQGTYGTNTNFKLILNPVIKNVKRFRIQNFSCVNGWLPLNPSSDLLSIQFTTVLDGVITITFKNGTYSIDELISNIQGKIDNVTTGFTVYKSGGYFYIAAPGGNNISVSAANLAANPTSSIWEYLGYNEEIAAGTFLVGDKKYYVSGPDKVYLCSDTLSSKRDYAYNTRLQSYSGSNIIYGIPVNVNSGGMIYQDYPSAWMEVDLENVPSLDFSLRYLDQSLIDLGGLPINFEIVFISY